MNRYTINELEEILSKNSDDMNYVKQTKEENRKKFSKDRFDEKYQISLAYYIMETDRFNELYDARKDNALKGLNNIYLPPKEIDVMLKKLSENHNYSYKEALSPNGPTTRKIPNPKKLIDMFLPEYKQAKDYTITFLS
jgi:hypothetical protein